MSYRHFGYIDPKETKETLKPRLYADAGLADDLKTSKSTSGTYLCLRSDEGKTHFPLSSQSQSQKCQSHSTPEAELVAMDGAVRRVGIPSLYIWNCILEREEWNKLVLDCHEDNSAMIQVVTHGRNPRMRHLGRTHGNSISLLHELFKRDEFNLIKCPTESMCADIFTKGFTDKAKWAEVCELINVVDFQDVKITPFQGQPRRLQDHHHDSNPASPRRGANSSSTSPSGAPGVAAMSGSPRSRGRKLSDDCLGPSSTNFPSALGSVAVSSESRGHGSKPGSDDDDTSGIGRGPPASLPKKRKEKKKKKHTMKVAGISLDDEYGEMHHCCSSIPTSIHGPVRNNYGKVSPGSTAKIPKAMRDKIVELLRSITWEKQKRQTTIGEGKCLGTTKISEGPIIHGLDGKHGELARAINEALLTLLGSKAFY